MSLHALREFVRAHAENRPGIYRWIGDDEEVLYVGKSVRVRGRLLSYFRAEDGDKAADLVRAARRVTWDYVPNEFHALVHEMRAIHRWLPRYNVQHRRKRRYAFVKITRERAPRVVPVTRVAADGATYYGPFPAVGRVADTVRELSRTLGLRDCPGSTPVVFGDQCELFAAERPPRCLRADTGTCLAPCAGRCMEEEYRERVALARRFLEGRGEAAVADLRERMAAAAARLDFEYAGLLRDRIARLRRFQEQLVAFRGRVRTLSFVYRVPGFKGDDRLYLVRQGRVREVLSHPRSREARARAAERIEAVFGEPDRGPSALRPREAAEILLVARWFRLRPREIRRTVPPDDWLRRKARPRRVDRPPSDGKAPRPAATPRTPSLLPDA